jgi:hypothetical protein
MVKFFMGFGYFLFKFNNNLLIFKGLWGFQRWQGFEPCQRLFIKNLKKSPSSTRIFLYLIGGTASKPYAIYTSFIQFFDILI